MAKTIQYINIIKEDKQLRIHSQMVKNKIVTDSKLVTIMLPNKNIITHEAIANIKSIKDRLKNTKIAILGEQIHQKALPSHLWVNKEKSQTYIIDANHSGITSKIYIDSLLKSFKDIKIDYMYSPYSILYNLVPNNACSKILYCLIINNIVYMVMFKANKISIMSRAIKIMSFSEVEKSKFYNDDTQKQIFFNQMYALELENAISGFIDEWYELTSHKQKLDKVLIACNVKHISNNAIENIKQNIGFLVQYESIDVNKYMLALNQVPNIQSFVPNTQHKLFSPISIKGIIKAYYNINKKYRKRGYIITCIAGIIFYRMFPEHSNMFIDNLNLFMNLEK
jgi:hypothetical protein